MHRPAPCATYVVKAWVKAVSGSDIWITAAGDGGSQVGQQMTSTAWTQSGNIVISLAGFEGESAVQVKLSDPAGRAYLQRQVQPRLEGRQVTLSVGHLPQGIFLVRVQGRKTAKTAKLVITR